MDKSKQPIFARAVGAAVLCFLFSFYLFHRATKDKSDFKKVKGVVEYIGTSSPLNQNNHPPRYRYLKVEGYGRPFELFIGKETGDFSPELEKIDTLQPGDTVTVYYDENISIQNAPVNRLAYFIDLNNAPVFVKGIWETGAAYFIGGFSVALFFWVFALKKKGKIE